MMRSIVRYQAAAVTIGSLRGFTWILALYFAAGWISMFFYDESAFPWTYRLRIHLLSAHLFLAAGLGFVASLAGLAREWLCLRAPQGSSASVNRFFRYAEAFAALGFGGVLAAAVVWMVGSTPMRLEQGLPAMRASSEFDFDVFSARPTIRVRTNSEGFRDAEWTPKEPSEGPRVLLLGDSIVFGSGITRQEETLTPRLQAALSDTNARVFNLSLNGLNFTQEVALLDRHAARIAPDLVVVIHNPENDLMPVLPYYEHPVLATAFLPAMLEWIYALDSWKQAHRLSEVPGRLDRFGEDLARLAAIADRQGFDVLFVYLTDHCPPPYHRSVRQGRRVFSFMTLGTLRDPAMRFPNDFHPNPAGVDRMAGDLAPAVKHLLSRRENAQQAGMDPMDTAFQECLGRVGSDGP